ncbi:MAG: hypothetical protein ABR905_01135 [Terracidiphilus sp.]|jgi:hypothetical protein
MKKSSRYVFLTLVLMFATTMAAHAKTFSWWERSHDRPKYDPPKQESDPPVAPEIDPGFALGGLSLLTGGLTILRARKGK